MGYWEHWDKEYQEPINLWATGIGILIIVGIVTGFVLWLVR